jgi:hypothetical protein
LHVPRPDIEKVHQISTDDDSYTYPGSVALEYAVVDLHNGTSLSMNSSALEVACGPPGIKAKISRKFLGTCFGVTYKFSSNVALEGAVMDLHIGIKYSINSSALEVGCPRPGIRIV